MSALRPPALSSSLQAALRCLLRHPKVLPWGSRGLSLPHHIGRTILPRSSEIWVRFVNIFQSQIARPIKRRINGRIQNLGQARGAAFSTSSGNTCRNLLKISRDFLCHSQLKNLQHGKIWKGTSCATEEHFKMLRHSALDPVDPVDPIDPTFSTRKLQRISVSFPGKSWQELMLPEQQSTSSNP